ncbi:MAG: hypothetical protein OEW95_06220 [Candidatus Bathyarchaeota archaeon]|nr:hypothetical protein [Candidatus Bathyarchaeota archaeon]
MKARLFAICLFLLLASVYVTSTHGIGEGEWIIKYSLENLDTGQIILQRDFQTGETREYVSLFGDTELNVTFTVDVAVSAPHINLRIATDMKHSNIQDRYWQLHSKDYPVVNYNPNQPYFEFNQIKGTLSVSCYGRIPRGITEEQVDGFVLHKPVNYSLIELTSPGGETLDQVMNAVLDAELDEFQNLLEKKEDKLQNLRDTGVAPGYIELFESVVNQAKAQAELGLVEEAIALLDLLAVSQEPVSSIMEMLFLPAVGILSVAVAAIGFVFLRTRGKIHYVLSIIEDQIKDLEGLTLRASKVDRTISSRLETIKDRLKGLIWA